MNECSSMWPSFQNSRPNWNDQFSTNSMNTWQNNNSSSDFFQTPVDFNNVWSAKSELNDEGDKDSFIKSIWSTSTSPSHGSTDNNISLASNLKQVDVTPTNSPSLNRSDLIVSNERWGNIKINQTTPWLVSEIDETDKRALDPMVWRAKIDGTEVWEEYYTKQHGKRRPQTDNSFNNENMWSSTSDISQSTNSLWSNKSSEVSTVQNDIFGPNYFNNGGNHANYNSANGVKPPMTRNQAQKYLQEMGFSLSDSIGALVNNQMDLPKALNELQSKYRMTTNGPNMANTMCNQSLPFNRTVSDTVNITRIPPGTPINAIGQNNSTMPPSMINTNSYNNIDMFHSDIPDQMIDPKYLDSVNMTTVFNRMPDGASRQQSMNIQRQDSFRNSFPMNNGGGGAMGNHRQMNQSNPTHYSANSTDSMNLHNQGISRVNMSFNHAPAAAVNMVINGQNNPYNMRPTNVVGNGALFNGLHNANNNNTNGNNNAGGNNNANLILNNNNNNANIDVRQNFAGGMPNVYGRSMSKPPNMFSMNNAAMNWHGDSSPSSSQTMSPNGAIPDMSQLRLAKNLSCSAPIPDKLIAIVIKKVQHKHIDLIKSICMEYGAIINFHLNPQAQSIIVQFANIQDAYRCINIIQNQLSLRVELINSQEELMLYMSGAN